MATPTYFKGELKTDSLILGTVEISQGVAVPDAAGANPTKAEFDALLASLRTAGLIAT